MDEEAARRLVARESPSLRQGRHFEPGGLWLTSGESSQSDLMDEATVKRLALTTRCVLRLLMR